MREKEITCEFDTTTNFLLNLTYFTGPNLSSFTLIYVKIISGEENIYKIKKDIYFSGEDQ